jgi:hypothetical protein
VIPRIWLPSLAFLLAGCATNGDKSTDALGDACPDDPEMFHTLVWSPALATPCASCHVAGGQAEGSGMVFLPEGADGWLEHNEQVAMEIARQDVDGVPLLVAKPSGLAGSHGGGTLIQPGSSQDAALRFWASWSRGEIEGCTAPSSVACTAEGPGARTLRRLTPDELDNTLTDLLGVDAGAAETLAADDVVDGFDNNAALDVSPLLADQLRTLAEAAAAEANLSTLLPCDPTTDGQAPCAARFVEDFGFRAFRRPLTQDDIDRYEALWETVASTEGFDEGVRWVVTAMLQSPHFLYRMELGEKQADGQFRLTGWEIATELSYLYWRTTPDEALLAAAADGSLLTADGLAAQVARLQADPRAAATVADFVDAWLELDQLDVVTRDPTVYPEFTAEVRADMRGETHRLVADVAEEGGTLSDLLQSRETFVTPALATFYGLDPGTAQADAEGFQRVELDGTKHGGLLTQGSVLARWALPTSSSPIHRGVLVRERLLCQDLPPPPSNLDTSPPEVDPTLSTRERYAAHASLPECAACHQQIDPIGFGFEHYDGVGRWRETDGGLPIDQTGAIVASPHTDTTFDGVFDLASVLAASADTQACYARMWTVWGTGVTDTESLTCAAETAANATAPGELSLLAPQAAIVGLAHFTARTGDAGETDTPAAGTRLTDIALPSDDGPWNDLPTDPTNVEWVPTTNSWGTAYCTQLAVTNNGTTAVDWQIETDVVGTVTSSWCVTFTANGADWLLTGSGSCGNTTLAPGATTGVGWCANY